MKQPLRSILALLLFSLLLFSCSEKTYNNTNVSPPDTMRNHAEYEKVLGAITDYVEALYTVDPKRIENSVDTTLRKIGYYYDFEKQAYIDNLNMSYAQLYDLAGRWNKDGDRITSELLTLKAIQIFDINDKSASAKLTAVWGIDYFHLSKVNERWKIMNVLWQSPPLIDKIERKN